MNDKYLIVNAGSSSLKFALYEVSENKEIVSGNMEKIGRNDSFYTIKFDGNKETVEKPLLSFTEASGEMVNALISHNFISSIDDIKGIGNRVLHGGEYYNDSVLIDETVMSRIAELTKFGPLHHPGEMACINSLKWLMPNTPQVAVFDTAFHQTIPDVNFMYAIPYEWYKENGVRKYGFHGTSHKYITQKLKDIYGRDEVNAIICHIGSGASITCIKEGKSYDTTMGLTPVDGLMMGTRSGSIDPSIAEYICKQRNIDIEKFTKELNSNGGLLGIAGVNDFRDIETLANDGNDRAKLAIEMLKKSIIKFIAEYYFELDGQVDALVFTAGIGENSSSFRKGILDNISFALGIRVDYDLNDKIAKFKSIQSGMISKPGSHLDVFVIPTDEESVILQDTVKLCSLEKGNTLKLTK